MRMLTMLLPVAAGAMLGATAMMPAPAEGAVMGVQYWPPGYYHRPPPPYYRPPPPPRYYRPPPPPYYYRPPPPPVYYPPPPPPPYYRPPPPPGVGLYFRF